VSDATRLYTVTIQLCLCATLTGFPRLRYSIVWVTSPGFPLLRYSFVCEWRHKTVHSYDTALFVSDVPRLSLVVWLPQTINEQHSTYDSTSRRQQSVSWNTHFLRPQCWRQRVNTFGPSHDGLTCNHTKIPAVHFDRLLYTCRPDFHQSAYAIPAVRLDYGQQTCIMTMSVCHVMEAWVMVR